MFSHIDIGISDFVPGCTFYDALAMRHGGTDEGKPGLRAHYHANYYATYFRDPDGNKLCVVCHEAVE